MSLSPVHPIDKLGSEFAVFFAPQQIEVTRGFRGRRLGERVAQGRTEGKTSDRGIG